MKTELEEKTRGKPLTLNSTDENILRMLAKFPFAGSVDVANYLFSPASITYVRSRLGRLSGGDHKTHTYLYRFCLPSAASGNKQRIFCLGAKGRALAAELGESVDFWYRPYKQRFMSFTNVLHHLILTRTVVAGYSFCRKQTEVRLLESRLCYELSKQEGLKVIADAFLRFRAHERFMPCWIEIDRGTEMGRVFRNHVRARVLFLQSGTYRELFQAPGATICYLTAGERPEYLVSRRKAICRFIMEVLQELGKESWASIFRVCSVVPDELYSTPLFDAPIWYRPDSPTPVRLFSA